LEGEAMRKTSVLKVLAFLVVGTTLMHAQASRTWVSGVGDDANPCSRTAPCKTWAGAISKTAPGGEIDALDPGGFGAVTITKAITLDGGGGQVASVLVSGTNGIVVAAGATDIVIIRNIRINGIRGGGNGGINGIRFINASGGALGIENCTIFGFTQHGIDIEPGAGGTVWIQGTTVNNNGGNGVNVVAGAPTAVSIDHSNFQNNSFGVLAGANAKVVVTNSASNGNGFGFVAQPTSASAELDIQNSTASNNANTGIFSGGAAGTATIRIAGNSIFGNAVSGLFTGGNGSLLSYGNNFNSSGGAPSGAASPGPQ
jgi:hypothetical protein